LSGPFVTDLVVLTNPYLDDLGCEQEKGHERGLREIHQLDPVWTLGSFWTLECKAKSFFDGFCGRTPFNPFVHEVQQGRLEEYEARARKRAEKLKEQASRKK
jgi:hypothetical protein